MLTDYPLLDGDAARRAIWLVDVPLAATHRLRNEINNGKPISPELLETYEVPIVASTLKLYLLELPDSIVSSNLYEIIKAIYTTSAGTVAEADASSTRVSVLQNTLSQLRLANIATLDAITTHFVRLIDLTSADEQYVATLTQSLAPCILRPRTETALSLEEKYSYRFVRDLLQFKDPIFNELKRAASLTNAARVVSASGTVDGRPRTLSTDESNRKAHMEERAKAIANRSRAASPAPRDPAHQSQRSLEQHQRHRRDSSRGAETRFPVHVTGTPRAATVAAPTTPHSHAHTPSLRQTLDIPGSAEASPSVSSGIVDLPVNGHSAEPALGTFTETPVSATASELGETNALGRATAANARFGRKQNAGTGTLARQTAGKRDSGGVDTPTAPPEERRGVELTDKPMDD